MVDNSSRITENTTNDHEKNNPEYRASTQLSLAKAQKETALAESTTLELQLAKNHL